MISEREQSGDAGKNGHQNADGDKEFDGIFLPFADIQLAQAGEKEEGADHGGKRPTECHLTDDGCACNIDTAAAEGFGYLSNDGHDAVVIGVGIEQNAERSGKNTDDRSHKLRHRAGKEAYHGVCHSGGHSGLAHNAHEYACRKDYAAHQDSILALFFYKVALHLCVGVVDYHCEAGTYHKCRNGSEQRCHHDAEDHYYNYPVDHHQFGAAHFKLFLGEGGNKFVQIESCAYRKSAVRYHALLFTASENIYEGGRNEQTEHLSGNEGDPKLHNVHANGGCGTQGGAAPRNGVHNACGKAERQRQQIVGHFKALEDGEHGRDHQQAGYNAGAVEMNDGGEDENAEHQSNGVSAGSLYDGVYKGVECACFTHNAEKHYREDEHDAGGADRTDTLGDVSVKVGAVSYKYAGDDGYARNGNIRRNKFFAENEKNTYNCGKAGYA